METMTTCYKGLAMLEGEDSDHDFHNQYGTY